MVDNVIPFIGGEEEKSEKEPLKIWGHIEGDKIEITSTPRTDFFVEVLMNVKIEHKNVKNIRRGK